MPSVANLLRCLEASSLSAPHRSETLRPHFLLVHCLLAGDADARTRRPQNWVKGLVHSPPELGDSMGTLTPQKNADTRRGIGILIKRNDGSVVTSRHSDGDDDGASAVCLPLLHDLRLQASGCCWDDDDDDSASCDEDVTHPLKL